MCHTIAVFKACDVRKIKILEKENFEKPKSIKPLV
jgi:hypothetical protein